MTREEFMNGNYFKISGSSNIYMACKDTFNDRDYWHVAEAQFNNDGKFLFSTHESNIESIGRKRVTLYTFVFGKRINTTLRFEDLELVTK